MKQFKAYIKEVGEECDYSISCGYQLIDLKGTSLVEALQDAERFIIELKKERGLELESLEVFEIASSTEIAIEQVYIDMAHRAKMDEGERKEMEERELFETLKKKYGSGN